MAIHRLPALFALLLLMPQLGTGAQPPVDDAFFEAKIRPVLVDSCVKCHGPKKQKGGLRVDGLTHLKTGGDTGPSLVPGKSAASRLLTAMQYKEVELQMPPSGKLPDEVLADFARWIDAGAPWPNDAATESGPSKSAFDLAGRQAEHWAWKPVTRPAVSKVKHSDWVRDPVDAFLLAQWEGKNLAPPAAVEKAAWLRRVTFALIGLPPTPEEVEAFLKDGSPKSSEVVVDRLLASPHFGERWGRHWLDLVRYAETRGHEFEPEIPNAWEYRDYVVRALNTDVPYNRFVLEHLAGDTLTEPRLNPATGANESILGTGFWHLGEEVHSPVDIRQDQADRLDNRIDVMTKTFLGLTVSCARCHDHKFDAVSARDYYALYGLLEGSSYRLVRYEGWKQNREVAKELNRLRLTDTPRTEPREPIEVGQAEVVVDYAKLQPGQWLPDDVTFGDSPLSAGAISWREGDVPFVEPLTAAVFDHFWANLKTSPVSKRDGGALGRQPREGFTIRTPNFTVQRNTIYALVRGGGTSYAGVCGHTVIHGPLHGSLVRAFPNSDDYRWIAHDVKAYRGLPMHLELTADPKTNFAVAMVIQSDTPPPALPRLPSPSVSISGAEIERVIAARKALARQVVWESRLAPSLLDGTGVNEHVFIRGNPKALGEVVPHRSLEALAGTKGIVHTHGSGRLELANQWLDPKQNPFLSRVEVNRVWHHLFGQGLVPTTDNFGLLGEPPTHPELLDYLADEFVRDGWSRKRLIRRLVLTSYYRSAIPIHRLEGEVIRDAILAVSGRLDPTPGGPSVLIHLTPFLDGRGRPASGPIDGNGRRSLYIAVRRNFLSPFFLAFDTPIPFSTMGRRQVSNVPAQSLILMNDPFVHQQATEWAKQVLKSPGSTAERIRSMYLRAYARPATEEEIAICQAFVKGKESDPAAWAALAHTLFMAKEFIFVR